MFLVLLNIARLWLLRYGPPGPGMGRTAQNPGQIILEDKNRLRAILGRKQGGAR